MTLLYKLKSGESKTIRVPFDPLLSKYEDVKPRLLGMKAEAQEGLGMVRFASVAVQGGWFLMHTIHPPSSKLLN